MTAGDWATCVAIKSVSNPGPAGGSSSFETGQHIRLLDVTAAAASRVSAWGVGGPVCYSYSGVCLAGALGLVLCPDYIINTELDVQDGHQMAAQEVPILPKSCRSQENRS